MIFGIVSNPVKDKDYEFTLRAISMIKARGSEVVVDDKYKKTLGLKKQFVDDYYKGGGTGAYKEGNPTAGFYENGIAKMAYKRIFIKHKKK